MSVVCQMRPFAEMEKHMFLEINNIYLDISVFEKVDAKLFLAVWTVAHRAEVVGAPRMWWSTMGVRLTISGKLLFLILEDG